MQLDFFNLGNQSIGLVFYTLLNFKTFFREGTWFWAYSFVQALVLLYCCCVDDGGGCYIMMITMLFPYDYNTTPNLPHLKPSDFVNIWTPKTDSSHKNNCVVMKNNDGQLFAFLQLIIINYMYVYGTYKRSCKNCFFSILGFNFYFKYRCTGFMAVHCCAILIHCVEQVYTVEYIYEFIRVYI